MDTTEDRRPAAAAPLLRNRRDSLMPIVASALSVRGDTYTCAGDKADQPPQLHPLVAAFLAELPTAERERFTGRCPEAVLLSQFFSAAEDNRSKRAARKPLSDGEARKALRGARMTSVRIREEGDPAHGTHQPPCRSCVPLLAHFGVQTVSLARKGA